MTRPIRKHISRLAHAPMERIRRRQAERTTIATIGLNLPIAYQNELQSEPNLQRTIDFLRQQPDGDHYLAEVALLPVRSAMARRALRAIADPQTQLLATAEVVRHHEENTGILETFWRRRLRRHIGRRATKLASSKDADLKTILTLGHVGDVVELPEVAADIVAEQGDAFRTQDDLRVTKIILSRLGDELTEQQEELRTEPYNPFDDEE